VDIRLGLTLAGIFAPLVALVLLSLYAFAADELLELAQPALDERLARLESVLHVPDATRRATELALLGDELARDSGGFTVRNAAGKITLHGGGRLPDEAAQPPRGPLVAIRIRAADDLQSRRLLSSGEELRVFISSEGFVRERDDIQRGFWASLALGIVLVAAASIPATRRALAPLRRATRAAQGMDAARLGARLPSRGTQDDVDQHAEAVNGLLDRIEVGLRRIEAFSQDVAHELRTPINRILNATEISLLEAGQEGADGAALLSIRDSAEQMARMVEGLLLLARSEEGHLRLRRERVAVGELCQVLEEMYRPACEERGLCLEIGPLAGVVQADKALLLRALGNLVDNAMAHTPEGGRIRLEARPEDPWGGWVSIDVSDTGPGIPASDRERIFDRFVSLGATCGATGAGLGLAITRTLIRAHGGEVELQTKDGTGAHFRVHLRGVGDARRCGNRGRS